MKFFYKKQYTADGEPLFLPLIDATIGNSQLQVVALVDSGASYSLFHAALGEHIGLNIKTGKKISSFGVDGEPLERTRDYSEISLGRCVECAPESVLLSRTDVDGAVIFSRA